MTNIFTSLRSLSLAAALTASLAATATADQTAPAGLQASVEGIKATLSWQRAGQTATLAANDFETALLPDGWTQRTTNDTDYRCSWFQYPTADFMQLDHWEQLLYKGDHSAIVYMDMGRHSDKPYTQNEWLISPDIATGGYLDFYTYINPAILEADADDDFKDHYYVKLSRDGGQTWLTLWDARKQCSPVAGWHQVSLALGSCPEGSLIAFQALSDEDDPTMPLHFTWGLDDISVSAGATTEGSYYRVYLDGQLLADHVQSLEYTDLTDKEEGSHTYSVTYVDAATGEETEAATQEITIGASQCNPPRNVRIETQLNEEDGTYDIMLAWDAPEGDRKPAYYNVYNNGIMAACWLEDLEFGNTGMARGVYNYTVSAVYELPDGESEAVGDCVAVGTPYPARNLTADTADGTTTLTWQAPKASDKTLAGYDVYRANTRLAACTLDTSLTDPTPEGVYNYAVKAVYTDGETALPATAKVRNGEALAEIPYEQTFDGQLTPDNWQVENFSEDCDDAYTWRFDDWFGTAVSGTGFDGNYAVAESMNAGFVYVESALVSPILNTEPLDGTELRLDYDMDFATEGESEVWLEYSLDRGETWEQFEQLQGYSVYDLDGQTCAPLHESHDITDIATGLDIMFRWNYTAMWDGHLAVDNVRVYQPNAVGVKTARAGRLAISCAAGRIAVSSAGDPIAEAAVYTAAGAKVLTLATGSATAAASTAALPAGVYVVKATAGKQKAIRKLVIQ